MNSWVVNELLPLQSNTVTFNGTEAVDMSAPGQEGSFVPLTSGNVGGQTATGSPSNVTGAMAFKTGLTGRSNRGRNFLIGMNSAAITGDSITPVAVGLFTAAYNELASYLTTLAADHVVASLYSGVDSDGKPIPRTAGVVHAVTAYVLDAALDSMRRRLIGRGQ